MATEQKNYRSIFKATAILGSVQLFNIIVGIIRNKIVSMILGPSGMGIVGLLTSSTATVTGFTNCGVAASSVKNVAMAYEKEDFTLLGKVIYTLKRLVTFTGCLGALIVLVFSSKLSQWSFGNEDFTISFACLSISVLFTEMTNILNTIVKGCRRIKYYAKANVLGNLMSLFITIPLYYLWGKDAIVPVLILLSVSTFVFAYHYERKLGIKEVKATKEEQKAISIDVLKMGLPLAASEIFPIMASYLIRLNISSHGGVEDVGLYSAGFAILNGYVGMIFTAMSSDFIPRLSAISDDNKACEDTINSQVVLSILILFPILLALITFGKLVVWVLYSSEFFPMTGMIYWGSLGMLWKTLNWCYGCVFVPKRDTKPYFSLSVLSAVVYLGVSVLFYNIWGVTGLGAAFLFSHTFDFSIAYIFITRKYHIYLQRSIFAQMAVFTLCILALIYMNTFLQMNLLYYSLEGLILIAATFYSFKKLNSLIDLKGFLKTKFRKK